MAKSIEGGPNLGDDAPESVIKKIKTEMNPDQKEIYESMDKESLERELVFINSELARVTPQTIEEEIQRLKKTLLEHTDRYTIDKQLVEAELEKRKEK